MVYVIMKFLVQIRAAFKNKLYACAKCPFFSDLSPFSIQEADSEDEWDTLCDATDPESCDPAAAMEMLRDKAFVNRLATSLDVTTKEVLQGMLEGASRLRLILRVVCNLLSLKGYARILFILCLYSPKKP